MRGWMRPLILSALTAVGSMTAGGALAQDAGKPAAPKTMAGSPLAQVPFAEQPFPLQDDGTFKEFMNQAAADVSRRCEKLESYGWEFPKGDDAKREKIFQSTMTGFGQAGWTVGEVQAKSIQDPGTTAYLADKDKRRLLLVWAPMEDSAILLLCDTAAAPAKKK